MSVSLFASHRFWKQKYDDILGSGERIILSKCIRQYGSIIDSAWISLTLLADTRATKSTVFKVRFLSELSSIGTNGGERNPLSTVGMSQVGVLFILAGLALLSDIRNRFISGSSASLVSMNEERVLQHVPSAYLGKYFCLLHLVENPGLLGLFLFWNMVCFCSRRQTFFPHFLVDRPSSGLPAV